MKIRWQSILALFVISVFICVAIAAPLISPPDDPANPDPYKRIGRISDRTPHPPEQGSMLGTVPTQLDVFHTLIWGTRSELIFGILVVLLSGTIGTLIGIASGYLGGAINRLVMRITDGFLTFPIIAAVVFIKLIFDIFASLLENPFAFPQYTSLAQAVSTKGSFWFGFLTELVQVIDPFTLAILLFSWMPYTRIVNGLVVSLKQTEFVEAAEALGVRKRRIIFKHLLPNVISPNIVLAARDVGGFVILRATFTYVGLTDASPWAVLLVIGRNYVIGPGGSPGTYWWVYLPITIAILLFGFGWNLLGDEINEWMDPRSKRRV